MSIIDSASNSFNLTKPLTKLVNMGCSVVGTGTRHPAAAPGRHQK
jgi:hypothetical protein